MHLRHSFWLVVRVLVTLAVVQSLHETRRRVAQVQRHGFGYVRDSCFGGLGVRAQDGIALRRYRHVNRSLGQRGVAFGHADEVHCLLGGHRDDERLRIRVPDVFRCEAHQPPRDVERVLP